MSTLQAQPSGRPERVVHNPIDETRTVALRGNTRPEANVRNDRGPLADSFPLNHLILQLKRSPEREAALRAYIDELHDPQSANYHQWLTPEQFAEHYGVAQGDVDAVSGWLRLHGFTVNGVQPGGLTMDFSGTVGSVRRAFHTEMHSLDAGGATHFANMSDPRIPAALAPVVAGIVSLHNFHPKPALVRRGNYTFNTSNGPVHAIVAGDIATIYNLNPVFAAGYTGKGQTIMVIEDTYLYNTGDWYAFRQRFGLTTSYPFATLTQVSPEGPLACANPGFQGKPTDPGYGDDSEAAIDVEWATAAAPNAAIVLAACRDTDTMFGGLIALDNVLSGPAAQLPSVVSISYGEAEEYNGSAANAAYNAAYQQAVAEGVSIFVSSGDEGAASADFGNPSTHGITISGFASTPYNVAVGGLDFGYVADGVPASTYWSPTNSKTDSSALSYIQEVPWNDSCAGRLVSGFFGVGPIDLCNNPAVASPSGPLSFLLNAVGGSGGPSACATGTPTVVGEVSGTCKGYPKPSWQSGILGNPGDGVRDIPDVSLFASNGFWDSYYVVCWSNPDPNVGGGFTCKGDPSRWAGFGGTSISSPIMAGIQVLINQKTGTRTGNPNMVYYRLAKGEYSSAATAAGCNSNTVNKTGNGCIFYDITQGDNDVVCTDQGGVLTNCRRPAGLAFGALAPTNGSMAPSYGANTGWDFATGIGSVNAWNLVMLWPK